MAPTTRQLRCSLGRLLMSRDIAWGELRRRTLLPHRRLAPLRRPDANPKLATAQRVADALGEPIERIWSLR